MLYLRRKCKKKGDPTSVWWAGPVPTCQAWRRDAGGCCGPDLHSGAPLAPGPFVQLVGTQFGFDINEVADRRLQPLATQPQALAVRGQQVIWFLPERGEISSVHGEGRGVGGVGGHVHATFDHWLASLMRTT